MPTPSTIHCTDNEFLSKVTVPSGYLRVLAISHTNFYFPMKKYYYYIFASVNKCSLSLFKFIPIIPLFINHLLNIKESYLFIQYLAPVLVRFLSEYMVFVSVSQGF